MMNLALMKLVLYMFCLMMSGVARMTPGTSLSILSTNPRSPGINDWLGQ